ncbi:MAG: hypothetical protein VXW87_04935 [Pseudomonadota bacterium]|nr:hypothetical protein [Pseudomonadota bacterium]
MKKLLQRSEAETNLKHKVAAAFDIELDDFSLEQRFSAVFGDPSEFNFHKYFTAADKTSMKNLLIALQNNKNAYFAVVSHGLTPLLINACLHHLAIREASMDETQWNKIKKRLIINDKTVVMHNAKNSSIDPGANKNFQCAYAIEDFERSGAESGINVSNVSVSYADDCDVTRVQTSMPVIKKQQVEISKDFGALQDNASIAGGIRYFPPKPPESTTKCNVTFEAYNKMLATIKGFSTDQVVQTKDPVKRGGKADKGYLVVKLTDEQLSIMEINGFNLNNNTITYEPKKTAGGHLTAKSHDEKMLDIIKSAGYLENINSSKLGGKVGVYQDHNFNPVKSLKSTIEEKLKSEFQGLYPLGGKSQAAEKTELVMKIADVLAVHGFKGFQTQTMGDIDLRLTSTNTLNSNIKDLRNYLENKGDTMLLFKMLSETGFQGVLDGSVMNDLGIFNYQLDQAFKAAGDASNIIKIRESSKSNCITIEYYSGDPASILGMQVYTGPNNRGLALRYAQDVLSNLGSANTAMGNVRNIQSGSGQVSTHPPPLPPRGLEKDRKNRP